MSRNRPYRPIAASRTIPISTAAALLASTATVLGGPLDRSPGYRYSHTAIYDPVRHQMVVFGGWGQAASSFNDLWAFEPGTTPAWEEMTAAGTPPSARAGHIAIYDPVRDRMIVFGGVHGTWDNLTVLDDTWELTLGSTPAWTQLSPVGSPPARYGHAGIYDPVRDRLVVTGGWKPGTPYQVFNDTWELTLSGTPTWTQLSPSGMPYASLEDPAIYDPLRDRMIVLATNLNEVWELTFDTLTWTQLSPSGTPPEFRSSPTAIYDPLRDRAVVFGGVDYVISLNDTWSLTLGETPTWTELKPAGTLPMERFRHSAIYDPDNDRMVVYGGETGADGRTWGLGLGGTPVWVQLDPQLETAVGLLDFDALPHPESIEIRWSVDSRARYRGFQVLRSENGAPFMRVTGSMILDGADSHSVPFVWRDEAVEPGVDYAYRLQAIHLDGSSEVWDRTVSARTHGRMALSFELRGSNPIRSSQGLQFQFYLPEPVAHLTLDLIDVRGRWIAKVLDGSVEAGTHTRSWPGLDRDALAAGIYFVRLEADGNAISRKIMVVE